MLQGKKGAILGVANKRSIAWAVARAASHHGAELALTYQSERLASGVEKLAGQLERPALTMPCDVSDPEQVDAFAAKLREHFGQIDFLVHSIAYAPTDELSGAFHDTTKEGFHVALDISVYSFVQLARVVAPILSDGASLLTMTYIGAVRVVPNYNLMGIVKAALESSVRYLAYDLGARGIRVNAVSAGPVRTLSTKAIGDFSKILDHVEKMAPLRRNITAEEVGDAATFLLSDLSRCVTGTVLYADAGYHIMGV